MFERPIVLAVVGHVNAGKTTVLRSLLRDNNFGSTSEQPGTTEQVESATRPFTGMTPLRFDDTPGLSDPVALHELMKSIPNGLTSAERIRALLRRPDARLGFKEECKTLQSVLQSDAVIYVIDAREAVLPKFHCELAILKSCAKPVLPLLNHLNQAASRLAEWTNALVEHDLQHHAHYDAFAPGAGSESRFLGALAMPLGSRFPILSTLRLAAAQEHSQKRRDGLEVVATCLVELAALRTTLSRAEVADLTLRGGRIDEFRAKVVAQARTAEQHLVRHHRFCEGDVEVGGLPGMTGRWEDDLFDPEALRITAGKLGTGAVVGAAIGLGLDLALAGLSLGVGTAVGAAVGGVANQGFGPMGRALVNKVSGQQDLTLETGVLVLLADRLLLMEEALECRGHGATGVTVVSSVRVMPEAAMAGLMEALSPARSHAEWAAGAEREEGATKRRRRVIDEVGAFLAKSERMAAPSASADHPI